MRFSQLPKWVVPAACGVVGLAAGAVAGMLLTDRRYKKVVDEVKAEQLEFDFTQSELDRELARATYIVRKMRDESDNLVSNIRDLATLHNLPVEASRLAHPSNRRNDPADIVVAPKEEESEGEVVHIFTKGDDDWDYELEMENRNPPEPYIIHRDEFFNDECGYGAKDDQRTFTWYAGDSVLCDEKDVPIYNHSERVGELKFGHGSGDENIVYVRNEKEEEEYEIVLDDGSYEMVVLGGKVVDSLEHSDLKHSRSPAKMRRND